MVWRNQGNCAGRWLELWRCLGFLFISQSGKEWSGRGRCDIISIPHTTTQNVVFPISYLSSPPLCILPFSFISFIHRLAFGFFLFFSISGQALSIRGWFFKAQLTSWSYKSCFMYCVVSFYKSTGELKKKKSLGSIWWETFEFRSLTLNCRLWQIWAQFCNLFRTVFPLRKKKQETQLWKLSSISLLSRYTFI